MPSLRAVQFVNSSSARDGGPALHALEVNSALNRLGCPTQLLVWRRSAPDSLVEDVRRRNGDTALPPIHLSETRSRIRLARAALAAPVWIVHGYYLAWIPPLVLLAALVRKPVLLMPHGSLTTYDRNRSRLRKLVFSGVAGWFVNRTVLACVATPTEADELPTSLRARARVMGAGAQRPSEVPAPRSANTPLHLLCLSRVAPKKRVDLSIRAIDSLRALGREATLSVVGAGEERIVGSLRQLVADLGLEGKVTFRGALNGDDKEAAFRDADVFLLPSDDENFGIAVVEAVVRGIPAVVSDRVAAVADLPSQAGRVLSRPTPESIAHAVVDVAADRESSGRAMLVYSQKFSWDEVGRSWVEAVKEQSAPTVRRRSFPGQTTTTSASKAAGSHAEARDAS